MRTGPKRKAWIYATLKRIGETGAVLSSIQSAKLSDMYNANSFNIGPESKPATISFYSSTTFLWCFIGIYRVMSSRMHQPHSTYGSFSTKRLLLTQMFRRSRKIDPMGLAGTIDLVADHL